MAIPTLTKADFTGHIKLAVDTFQTEGFNNKVATLYEDFLLKVLGAFAVSKIKALTTLPELYVHLLDGVTFKDVNLHTCSFEGLQKVAKYFIYADLREESNYLNTNTGDVTNKNENAFSAASAGAQLGIKRYNEAINKYRSIWDFIYTYQTMNGIVSTVTPGAGSQVLTLDTVQYIVVNSYVFIGSEKYEVTAIDYGLNTITITDTVAVNVSDTITWHPFEEMPLPRLNYSCF